ncbi:MAG TPA: hypothetical protein VFJ16_29045 [Longimicrobium sp.]|nr:hypothetical protein [Longimicrobium sp.]
MPGQVPGYNRPMTATEASHWAMAFGTLRQLEIFQMSYHGQHGRYAGTLRELEEVGWQPGTYTTGYPRIVRHRKRLCVAMVPLTRELPAWSMGVDGKLHRGLLCGRPW